MFAKKLSDAFKMTVLGLSLSGAAVSGVSAALAGESLNTASEVASVPSVSDHALYSFKGKKVLVRLLNVKDRDWIGQCIDEDSVSITVQINNNVFQFFFSEIEYIESQ